MRWHFTIFVAIFLNNKFQWEEKNKPSYTRIRHDWSPFYEILLLINVRHTSSNTDLMLFVAHIATFYAGHKRFFCSFSLKTRTKMLHIDDHKVI